jgi:hypothetical protein
MLVAALVAAPAHPAVAAQYAVKVSLSRQDPDQDVGTHPGKDPVAFYVFADGAPNRGGEFGLTLVGADCVGFVPDSANAWMTLPVANPYPGTISQAKGGEECPDPPVCYGKLLVMPKTPGGRIVVDVIPSERAQDAAILGCDLEATNWFVAYPAVLNPGKEKLPEPHVVARPGESPELEAVSPHAPPGAAADSSAHAP